MNIISVPVTCEDWLPILAARLDERHPRIRKLRRYSRGRADLPEMGRNVRASWEAFQRKARTDYGGIAVRSLRNRIRPVAVRIGETDDHPALPVARLAWRNNRLSNVFKGVIRDYLVCGIGYVTVTITSDGARITREKPEQFIADPDPETPWKARASLKVWRDQVRKQDYARVTIPGVSQLFVRDSLAWHGGYLIGAKGDNWQPLEVTTFAGDIGVIIFDREDDGSYIESHIDVIDRINLGKLQRLVTTAMQAFKQRAIRGGLPELDEDGNAIDWKKAFEPAPGALWDLPEGIDIWESQQTDIRPLLEGEKVDARDFAAATGTPISVLLPDGQNQSAEGAAAGKEQQIAQAQDDIDRLQPLAGAVILRYLQAVDAPLDDATIEVLFAPPEHVSMSEKYAAAVQAKAAGLSGRTIKRDILGMTPDQILQDERDSGADMLAAALMGQQTSPSGG